MDNTWIRKWLQRCSYLYQAYNLEGFIEVAQLVKEAEEWIKENNPELEDKS